MARTVIEPTAGYVLASATAAVFTVKKVGTGQLYFNDVNTDDDAAEVLSPTTPRIKGLQLTQNLVKNYYVRTTGNGWQIVVEEG